MTKQERLAVWQLPARQFNDWRKQNDLPRLFDYLRQVLPRFSEWVQLYFPNITYLAQQDFPGRLINGSQNMQLLRCILENGDSYSDALPHDSHKYLSFIKRPIKILEDRAYVPYLRWARQKYGRKPFILWDKLNKSWTDEVFYASWTSSPEFPNESVAALYHDFPVLKLGGVELRRNENINGRNLDFTDLDYLQVRGSAHGNQWCHISYSSCRGISIRDAQHAFLTFDHCQIEDLLIKNCRIQDLHFQNSEVRLPSFEESYLNRIDFIGCLLYQPNFYRSELYDFLYVPRHPAILNASYDTYRRIRIAFQSQAEREQSRMYYYLERVAERRWLYTSFYGKQMPNVPFSGSLHRLLNERHRLTNHKFWQYFFAIVYSKVIGTIAPKYALRLASVRLRFIGSFLNSMIWGYGERPFRPILNSILTISAFTVLYFFSDHPKLARSIFDSIYFSLGSFTTLVFGDITPGDSLLIKIAASGEAFLGAVLMGFLIAGLANRSRY